MLIDTCGFMHLCELLNCGLEYRGCSKTDLLVSGVFLFKIFTQNPL